MFNKAILPFLDLQMLASAMPQQHPRASGVEITSLVKNGTSTDGSGNVAAAGNLTPFGDIGIGCGINWKADTSYGGELVSTLRNLPKLTSRIRRSPSRFERLWIGQWFYDDSK